MATSVRIKACGGLGPYVWTVSGPASVDPSSGTATTVSCTSSSATPVVVTCTDAAGIAVSQIMSGSCVCASDCTCDDENTGTPCTTDYMRYCYESGDVTWSNTPLVLEFWSGDGGCAGGSSARYALAASGVNSMTVSTTDNGGFALYYGELNPNQIGASGREANAHTFELKNFSSPALSNITGTPRFGIAVNCPATNTCNSFTGLVLMFDYVSGSVILGSYSGADLSAGTMPTTIATLATIPDLSDLNEIILQNGFKSGGVRVIQVYLLGTVSYEFDYEAPPAQDLVSTTAGYGIFWLKSAAAAGFKINYDDNTASVLTYVT